MEMLQKYLPEDMIIEIMSYLHFDIILKIDVPFKYFKNILISRCHNKMPDNWYKGMYNNMYHQCFKCERMMNLHLHITVICSRCEIIADDIFKFPTICINCVKTDTIVSRGKIFSAYCPSCCNKRMHLGITSYS